MRGPDQRKVKAERRLRRQLTDAEMVLWLSIRDRRLSGFKFVRQEAIESFIVDFVCREKKLIIEVDGGQHFRKSARQGARPIIERRRISGFAFLEFGCVKKQRRCVGIHSGRFAVCCWLSFSGPSPGPCCARATLSP